MDASRFWVIARESEGEARMTCNLLPPDDYESIERWLMEMAAARPKASIANGLAARLPERVAAALVGHVGIDPTLTSAQMSREARRALTQALSALPLPITQHRGWNYAEVTAGGVPLNEVNFRTMESRIVAGLHLCGEM